MSEVEAHRYYEWSNDPCVDPDPLTEEFEYETYYEEHSLCLACGSYLIFVDLKQTVTYTTPCCTVCGSATEITLDAAKFWAWKSFGHTIQAVWPEMSDSERKLLNTGTHAACWERMCLLR